MTNMTKQIEAMKLALDLVTMHHSDDGYQELRQKVRRVAKAALAEQPAPKVVDCHATGVCVQSGLRAEQPAQQEPVLSAGPVTPEIMLPLTQEERNKLEGVFKTYLKPAQQEPVREDWGPGPHEYHSLPVREPEQPAQRKPLTDEEIENIIPDDDTPMSLGEAFVKFARAIEAAHGIKGKA